MSDTYLTRDTLLKRLQTVDDDLAWQEFLFYYKRFIYAVLGKIGVRQSDFDDLAQKVLLKVWKSLHQFNLHEKRGKFRNWLYTVTRNTAYNYINRDKSYTHEHDELDCLTDKILSTSDIDDFVEEEWKIHISTLALENLKKSSSETSYDILQASIHGESISSIASRLDMKEDTVWRYKNRMKKKLLVKIKSLRDLLD